MTNARKGLLITACLAAFTLMSGCTYESDTKQLITKNEQSATQEGEKVPVGTASSMLQKALAKAKSEPTARHFWYKGQVVNTILSRKTTSMFEGAVNPPDSYTVNARIAGQPYQYYRNKDKRYINNKSAWMTAAEEPLPIDVLKGFDDWIPFMDQAVKLDTEKIIGIECEPYQIKMSAKEWFANSQSPLFEPLRKELESRPDMEDIIHKSTIKMTMWFSKEDQLIHQYETWLIIPLPGGGYMDQQVLFQFYKYTDKEIDVKDPEEVEKYLLY